MSTLLELNERRQKLLSDARAKFNEIKDDTDETRAREIESEYDAIMADHDKVDANIKALEAREEKRRKLEAQEAAAEEARTRPDPRRPAGDDIVVDNAKESEKRAEEHRKAFCQYLRYGINGLSPEERAVLSRYRAHDTEVRGTNPQSTTTSAGGYTVAEGFMAELVKSLKAWGPMMDMGVVRYLGTATGASMPWPTMDDTSNTGALLSENTQITTSDLTFGTKNLDAYKFTSGLVLVSSELLQDSALDVEGIVRDALSERIARVGNTYLTTGNGSSQPNGVATAAAAGVTGSSATAVTFDDIIDLIHSVDPLYRNSPSVRFMFNDGTLKALRKIKDGDGNYIWQQADVRAGIPDRLFNYQYSINQDVAAIGTGNRSILFGDFSKYVWRQVLNFSIRRLTERYADYDQTAFFGFTRFDGELVDTAAVKRLTHP